MGCFSQDGPAPVNYGQETTDTLNAQVKLAPQLLQSEQQYDPQYSSLAVNDLANVLNGTPAGPKTISTPKTANQTGWFDTNGNFISPGAVIPSSVNKNGMANSWNGIQYQPGDSPGAGDVWRTNGDSFSVDSTKNVAATPGLTSLMAGANTAQRQSDISDVQNLGPAARAAVLASNPDNAELLSKLNTQANAGLDAGSMLTTDQQTAMQQQSRAAFAARGMTGGNTSIADELLKQFNLGQQLLQQRQGFAQSVIGNNQQVVGDPFQQILGRPSNAVNTGMGVNSSAGPSLFNPQSSTAASMAAGNQAYAAMFAAPSGMSDASQSLGLVGNLVGGIAGGMSI